MSDGAATETVDGPRGRRPLGERQAARRERGRVRRARLRARRVRQLQRRGLGRGRRLGRHGRASRARCSRGRRSRRPAGPGGPTGGPGGSSGAGERRRPAAPAPRRPAACGGRTLGRAALGRSARPQPRRVPAPHAPAPGDGPLLPVRRPPPARGLPVRGAAAHAAPRASAAGSAAARSSPPPRARATRRSAAGPGASAAGLGGRRFRVGANVWVLRPGSRATVLFKVRGGPGARGGPRRPPAHQRPAPRAAALPEELLVSASRCVARRGARRGRRRRGPGADAATPRAGDGAHQVRRPAADEQAPARCASRSGRVGTVRLYARVGRTRLAVGRLARFRKPGRKRVSLRLTRPAARLLEVRALALLVRRAWWCPPAPALPHPRGGSALLGARAARAAAAPPRRPHR